MQIKKNLPHINLKGYYQFVTFRTQDSLDNYITKIRTQNIKSKKREYLIDKYLDITLKKIKGESAYKINKMLNKSGKFWEKNYYDKVIRNEEHFNIVYNYIKFNGFKAGLEEWEDRFYGIYE